MFGYNIELIMLHLWNAVDRVHGFTANCGKGDIDSAFLSDLDDYIHCLDALMESIWVLFTLVM